MFIQYFMMYLNLILISLKNYGTILSISIVILNNHSFKIHLIKLKIKLKMESKMVLKKLVLV